MKEIDISAIQLCPLNFWKRNKKKIQRRIEIKERKLPWSGRCVFFLSTFDASDSMRNHLFVSTFHPFVRIAPLRLRQASKKRSFKQITPIFHLFCCDRSHIFSVSSISIKRLVVHTLDIFKFWSYHHTESVYLYAYACAYRWQHITMLFTANSFRSVCVSFLSVQSI